MVLIDGKKYACETCIKGHRSSACKHTERPLFEIKKKGRPVTQCEHCRELRKTKQVHVKCICEIKDNPGAMEGLAVGRGGGGASGSGGSGSGSGKKGSKRAVGVAVFPNGLPPSSSSGSLHNASEGGSSDSDSIPNPGPYTNTCDCKNGGECRCATPRTNAKTRSKKVPAVKVTAEPADLDLSSGASDAGVGGDSTRVGVRPNNDPNAIHLRPVLPRPPSSSEQRQSPGYAEGSSMRSPGGGGAGYHLGRWHGRGAAFWSPYSPYGGAYDYARGGGGMEMEMEGMGSGSGSGSGSVGQSTSGDQGQGQDYLPPEFLRVITEAQSQSQSQSTSSPIESITSQWPPLDLPSPQTSYSLCGCGETCACPGCLEHHAPGAAGGGDCEIPNSCASCLSCSILTLPDPGEEGFQGEWVDQQQQQTFGDFAAGVDGQEGPDPAVVEAYLASLSAWNQLYPLQPQASTSTSTSSALIPTTTTNTCHSTYPPQGQESPCCGGRCKCPVGQCTCAPECCGCCQGCECEGEHEEGRGEGRFEVSGERGVCCAGRGRGAGTGAGAGSWGMGTGTGTGTGMGLGYSAGVRRQASDSESRSSLSLARMEVDEGPQSFAIGYEPPPHSRSVYPGPTPPAGSSCCSGKRT